MTESKESPQKTRGTNIGELCKEQLRRLDEFFALCLHNAAAATADVQLGVDAGKAGVDFRMVDGQPCANLIHRKSFNEKDYNLFFLIR